MSARTLALRMVVLAAVALGTLVAPSLAAAVPSATLSVYEYGWCCAPVTQDGTFKGHEFEIANTGDTPLDLETLRVTFDPDEYRWEDDADADTTDSEFYTGAYDALDVWNGSGYEPISMNPAACVEESANATEVVYACDLEGWTIALTKSGWIGLKALLPAAGFDYGTATVGYEVSFVGAPIPPLTDSAQVEYIADNSNLQVLGGYLGDPALLDPNWSGDYRDYDGESTGITYGAGDVVPYRFLLENPNHATDPTSVAHGITIDFNIPTDAAGDWETQFQDGSETATGGLTNADCVLDSDNGTDQDWACTFDGHVPVGGSSLITLPIQLIDGVDLASIEFDVETINGTIDSFDDPSEYTYGSAGACDLPRFFGGSSPTSGSNESNRYQLFGTASIAELESGDPVRFELPCLEPEPAPLTNFSSTTGTWNAIDGYSNSDHIGIFRGPANASYSWLSNEAVTPGPSNAYAFTWEAAGLAGLMPGDVLDTTRIAARPAIGGDYYRIMFHVTVEQQADLSAALSGPSSLEVASGGSNATYTATVTNSGPDAATSARVKVQLAGSATYVSATPGTGGDSCSAAGQLVTCTIANLNSGQSRTFDVVASYKLAVNGLSLPATANTTATAELLGGGTDDPTSGNDAANAATGLTAPPSCAAGQTGTPPNCTTPATTCPAGTTGTPPSCITNLVFMGNGGSQTFNGGSGNDRFTGSLGAERFFGGSGNDRALGGGGNDQLLGGAGQDFLRGGPGNDVINGGPGRDILDGGFGKDRVTCGDGELDRAFGGHHDDTMLCRNGMGGDLVNGGPGNDTCIGDRGDTFQGCERIINSSPRR